MVAATPRSSNRRPFTLLRHRDAALWPRPAGRSVPCHGLIVLGFVFAMLAMIAGAAATWGGLSALDGALPPVREGGVFRPILFFAFDREPLPEFPPAPNDNNGAKWEIRYRRTAVSRRNLLHASRTLGVFTVAIVAALAVVLLLAGAVAPAPTDVIVVHGGHLTCGPKRRFRFTLRWPCVTAAKWSHGRPGQVPAGRAGARPVIFSLSSHNSRARVSSRAAADGSRRWRLT
jgi:hypothetical protein